MVHCVLLYLFIYCLVQQRVYQSRVHDIEELLDIRQGLQQSAVDSAIDGEHVFAPAYGSKKDILSSDNMLNKDHNTVWSELCECIRANSPQTVL